MTRNLNRRVEIACPIFDSNLRDKLKWLTDSQLNDTAKASMMLSDGSYNRKQSAVPFDSQAYFMDKSPHIPVTAAKKESILSNLKTALIKILQGSN